MRCDSSRAGGSFRAAPDCRHRRATHTPPPTIGIATRHTTPRIGEKAAIPTSIVAEVTIAAIRGEYMCAKISPRTMSSRETRRDVFPAVSARNDPSGRDATLSPIARCMFDRKSKATE